MPLQPKGGIAKVVTADLYGQGRGDHQQFHHAITQCHAQYHHGKRRLAQQSMPNSRPAGGARGARTAGMGSCSKRIAAMQAMGSSDMPANAKKAPARGALSTPRAWIARFGLTTAV